MRSVPAPVRDPALDLLRAGAILAVLGSHVVWTSPFLRPAWRTATSLGGLGVDLFFVLSGWLIGGLFWRERLRFGRVALPRFILRRALRTVPPYAVALALDLTLVSWAQPGRELFDWHYLVFLQNYLPEISLFNISWSLCVEEHFYLVFPLAISFLLLRVRRIEWIFAALFFVPLLLRTFTEPVGRFDDFAFHYYATHLHFEALVAGVWAAWLRYHEEARWARLQQFARAALPLAPLLAVGFVFLPEPARYRCGFTVAAAGFTLWLVAWVGQPARFPRLHAALRPVALGAFSAYLTHMFAIHAAVRLSHFASGRALAEALYYAVAVVAIAASATGFYFVVERPAQSLRSRLVPTRAA